MIRPRRRRRWKPCSRSILIWAASSAPTSSARRVRVRSWQNKGLSGKVKVVAFDATETAIEMLKGGTVDMVIAQKPADMGYFAVEMAMANMNGVTSVPDAYSHRLPGHHPRQHERSGCDEVLLHQVTVPYLTVGARSIVAASYRHSSPLLMTWNYRSFSDLPFLPKLCHDQVDSICRRLI